MRKLTTMGFAMVALAATVAASSSSCSQTPTNVPIRTFEGAKKVAVVCLQVLDIADPAKILTGGAIPVTQDNCAPVASGVTASTLPYHLIAAVTQSTRGELAIVDLTGGYVVDEDPTTPGYNFIPVGTNPTDVAIPPDGMWTYVSSASPTQPAIYAIDSHRLLGNSAALDNPSTAPLQLTNLMACSLPQAPLALAIAPMPGAAGVDGGVGADSGVGVDGGGGGGGGATKAPYALMALLGGEGSAGMVGSVLPRVVAIDPTNFIDWLQPAGALPPCVILGGVDLTASVPPSWLPGPAWPDGVPYVDGGVDLDGQSPPLGPPGVCSAPLPTAPAEAGVVASEAGAALPDAAAGGVDAGAAADGGLDAALEDGGEEEAAVPELEAAAPELEAAAPLAMVEAGAPGAPIPVAVAPDSTPNPVAMVMRDDLPLLYVADQSLPLIHVIDLTNPSAPTEIEPLLATSVAQPLRPVQVGGLALSPPTRDYKRYLYAIDSGPGTLIVYDVTNGAASPHVPLVRPNAQLDPFAPPDRLVFSAPVATLAFAQHDWPVQVPSGTNLPVNVSLAYTGLLCNPNPNAHPDSTTFNDLGAFYRADQAGVIQANGVVQNFPTRLRGIFAFATLANGTVVTIDVDDWDAPCRRPDPMDDGGITGDLAVPEPAAGAADGGLDLSQYHVPLAYQANSPSLAESPAVTLEPFFPVSAPNRVRSDVLVRNDPTSGVHVPNLTGPPQLTDMNGTPVATTGQRGTSQPLLLPTVLPPGWIDPSLVANPSEPDPALRTPLPAPGTAPSATAVQLTGVRLSFDDPTIQQNQDWTVTYEGVIPSSAGVLMDIAPSSPGNFSTLTFTATGANFCGLGIEDWGLGQARANAALSEMAAAKLPVTPEEKTLPSWTTDYVEITDDILVSTDPYWGTDQACWDIPGTDLTNDAGATGGMSVATRRYDLCQATFGQPGSNPDLNVTRDAPILQAYTDHFVVGRFGGFTQLETTNNRSVDPGSANNPTFLKLISCCFHNQAGLKIRAGGEWVAVGQQNIGFLNHVVAAPPDAAGNRRCVLSCDPQFALLNARSFDVPSGTPSADLTTSCQPAPQLPSIGRNDPLAMRNPLFSYVTWGGCGTPMNGEHTVTARDLNWKFSIGGGFTPLTISLGGTTGAFVSPQSMLFIPSLGQMAVVDGAQQGLVLIDLNTVAFSTNYF